MSDWTLEWPTEPGLYLFFGDAGNTHSGRFKPRLHLCSLANNGIITCGGVIFFKSEQHGAFRPFSAETPDLEAMFAREDNG